MSLSEKIKLYQCQSDRCSYLADQEQTFVVIDPEIPLTNSLYTALLASGFRRSGDTAYIPHCRACQACIPIRVPVHAFKPSRSQRRNMKLNNAVQIKPHPAKFSNEHYALYCKYQHHRHPDSSMCSTTPEDYLNFLTTPKIDTVFFEFRTESQLLAVAVTDVLEDALSAVYTYYDPDHEHRGLGTFAILWQIEHALSLKIPWVYLGFWIEHCQKMTYKTRFQPCEGFENGTWRPITPREA